MVLGYSRQIAAKNTTETITWRRKEVILPSLLLMMNPLSILMMPNIRAGLGWVTCMTDIDHVAIAIIPHQISSLVIAAPLHSNNIHKTTKISEILLENLLSTYLVPMPLFCGIKLTRRCE